MKNAAPLLMATGLLVAACASTVPAAYSPPSATGIGIRQDFIPEGRYGRWRTRPMTPRYITIHSTQNFSRSGTAHGHAQMLKRGALKGPKNSLGYLTWHFTVDDRSIYQSLPVNEQGQHADYEGPGNRYSIGIEMCENRGGSREATIDRTARLTAHLMKQHGIPISNVVPHRHWRQIRYADKRDLGHKNCPHFLMDGGRPGAKWQAFLRKVEGYRRRL
jgi:N-acetylmuramoyl-L-alanine amidase